MIKNIVLDMGNVLLDYNPDVCLNLFVREEEDRQLIKRELFEGPEWKQGDLGYITDEERFAGVSSRVPKRLHRELKQCVEKWDVCMLPIPGAKEFCEYGKRRDTGCMYYPTQAILFIAIFQDLRHWIILMGLSYPVIFTL